MGDKDVSYEMESEATEFVLNFLGINNDTSPSLTSLGIQLEKLKLADDKYLCMWIIYVISSFLAPTTATTVSPRCYPSVVDAGNIKNLNWCKFVISTLQKTAKAGKNTNSACLLYMMEKDRIVITVQNLCEGFSDVTSSDDEDFVADEEVEDTEEDEDTNEDGDSDDDEDKGEEDDDDEGEEDNDEDRSENDDNDGAESRRSGEQADAATGVIGCKGDDTNEGIGSGGKGGNDVIGNGKQVDEGIGFGDKEKHEEKQAPNAAAQNVEESEKQPVQKVEKYPFLTTSIDSHEVPNFNLGFDSSQEVVQTPKGQEAAGTSQGKEFPEIITNEDYGSFTTEDYEKVGREADEAIANKSVTKSPVAEVISKEAIADDCEVEEETPVPHEYNKRVVKPVKFKSLKIIDTGEYYIYLADLANSVKPMGSLDNNTCELALIVLSTDIKDNSKRIFLARIGGYLLDSQLDRNELKKHFDQTRANRLDHKELAFFPILQELGNGNDKAGHYFVVCLNMKAERFEGYLLDSQLDRNELKKHFDQTRANRLDHKELAFFPILQELGNGNDKAGHYFVVCLNMKAERFEVYDSLWGEDDEELISASNLVGASMETMWDRFYMRSSKKTIQNYPLFFIEGPKQDNMYVLWGKQPDPGLKVK
uniref:Ubiquitin-like protease family profile domain-containing protein n=1 Tax=Oryza meridionalis TaxID=40149 RepID=A0A0E0D2N9_9ORYZ